MVVPPIDVLVPGREGEWLVRALLDAGLPARRGGAPSTGEPERPRLRILALGVDEDPLPALERLCAGGGADPVPVVLVGGARLGLEVTSRHGVAAMLDRHASVARIVTEVERLLARGDGGNEASVVLRQGGCGRGPDAAAGARRTQVLAGEADARDEGPLPDGPAPRLSEQLAGLLWAADRRLFPEAPRLDLAFAGAEGELSAAELVPDEMLFSPSAGGQGGDLDPVDDPTFLGDAALLAGDAATLRTPSAPALPDTSPDRPASVRPEGAGAGGPALRTSRPPPREVFPAGADGAGALRALWELSERTGTWSLQLNSAEAGRVDLTLRDGRVVAFDGPVWVRVAERLGHRLAPVPPERLEVEAWRSLEADVEHGTLSAYLVDGTARREREVLLFRALTSPDARGEAHPAEDAAEGGRPLFAHDALGLLFEAARRRMTVEEVEARLGGEGVGPLLTNTTLPRLVAAGIEPELVAFLDRHQGEALGELLRRLDPSVGLAGIVFALHVTAALDILPEGGRPLRVEAERAEALLRASYRLALGGDYFAILGLAPTATAREVQAAFAARRAALAGLALPVGEAAHLERVRDEVLDALEEARAILADDRLRAAYAAALAPPS